MKEVPVKNMESKYYCELNIARGIAVILVLLGHSFPDAQTGFSSPMAKWIFDFVYSFHMALFFMLSGFVTSSKIFGITINIKQEILKKSKRLLLPYFSYTILTIISKYIFNDYANNPLMLSSVWKILLGENPNGGLWYLWTLFVLSIIYLCIGRLISKRKDIHKTVFLFLTGIITLVLWGTLPISTFSNLLRYAIYYVLGILLCHYYDFLKNKLFKLNLAVVCVVVVMFGSCTYIEFAVPYIITAILGSYAVLTISIYIMDKSMIRLKRFLNFAGNFSYEIYLNCYFVQVGIRIVCWRILGIPYWIDVFLMLTLGFVVPCILTIFIINKSKLLSILLSGK